MKLMNCCQYSIKHLQNFIALLYRLVTGVEVILLLITNNLRHSTMLKCSEFHGGSIILIFFSSLTYAIEKYCIYAIEINQ